MTPLRKFLSTASTLVPTQPQQSLSIDFQPNGANQSGSSETQSNSLHKASASSHSGWLNYLATRASQKKITSSSAASVKSGKGRQSMETTGEVMDFSNDPDFPPADEPSTEAPKSAPPKLGPPKDNEKTLIKKASQNLAERAPSVVSGKSDSHTAAAPRNRKTSSALPPPPAPAQPNFVIPTFSDTFDRPPRSLPPAQSQQGAGLAWRAIGAVGSYMYGSEDKTSSETRGMKEGRKVGRGLPRRMGLAGAGEDDGWKHVKRVAVVGVHGWFPAKMLNS